MNQYGNAHTAQMKILRALLFVPSARFVDLQKQTTMTSDHFSFHIKQLIAAGFVEKSDDTYALTRSGKEYANRMDTDENVIEIQPKLSVVLVVDDGTGKFIAQQRLKQPYFGFWGRPTGKIRRGETLLEAAGRELLEETGLTAELRVSGFYHKMDYDSVTSELLDDKLFVLVHCTKLAGELIVDDEGHHNEWLSHAELMTKDHVFESIQEVTALTITPDTSYIEKKYWYQPQEY